MNCFRLWFSRFMVLLFVFVMININFWHFAYIQEQKLVSPTTANTRYAYYVCTQIYNEMEQYLVDWLDHQFNVVGFKNVCLINVGKPLSTTLKNRFPFAYIEKSYRGQEFHYCLSSCFIANPMRKEDMLMVQDIDEYLNIRKADEIFLNYNQYNRFQFKEIRYGRRVLLFFFLK